MEQSSGTQELYIDKVTLDYHVYCILPDIFSVVSAAISLISL